MRYKKLILPVIALLSALGLYFWMRDSDTGQDVRIRGMDAWMPKVADLKNAMTPVKTGEVANSIERKRQFCGILKKQFRVHEMAVGFRLNRKDQITILVEPRLDPWIIDKIAALANQAVEEQFGGAYNIKVFETYIGTASALVAEGTHPASNPKQLIMKHHAPIRGQKV